MERVRAAGTDVRFELCGDCRGLPEGVGLSAYRIVREGLSNAVRHAPGAPVEVLVQVGPGQLRLLVQDTGAVASAPEDTAGREKHGLLGMRERAALGGTFSAGRLDSGGFAVAVTVPLDQGGQPWR
ncbi:sensor histidine kinase [Amycolatopsis rubida]|uniref:sensor histidine kinase n=1 Tax=Amycolatopsis rubida TaxID=112413 RepID=UPI003CC79D68